MPTVIVEVMPKDEILDPQGKAIAGALRRTSQGDGVAENIRDVRVGKRFEITCDGPVTDALREAIENLARDVLSNDVIEKVVSISFDNDNDNSTGTLADA